MRFWMMAAAAMAIAAPASAQLALTPGQGVSVTIDEHGTVTMGDGTRAALGAHGEAALEQMRAMHPPADGEIAPPVPVHHGKLKVPAVPADRISFGFVVADGRDSVLVVENGYVGRAFVYRARITVKGDVTPTDVCLVMPGKRSYEHWPYVIDKIELAAFALKDWTPDDPVTCE